MRLDTPRLLLAALAPEELFLLSHDISALERRLGFTYRGEWLDDELMDIVKGQHDAILDDSSTSAQCYLWHTFWLFVLRGEHAMIGSAGFKGPPDQNGHVEIGYGIAGEFGNLGYTTEAVCELTRWALSQDAVNAVTAEVGKNNIASQKVLERCGFARCRETDDFYWYIRGK